MANWSGTYTNPNSIGTSTGMNGSNTLNDTTANFPNLVNQYITITAGLGVGQEKQIAGNGLTNIIIFGSWDIIPNETSQYKIVLRLENGDHIVAATTINTGVISELEDNATIYVDGNYIITIGNATEILWNKSRDTIVTFEANNRDTQGKYGFWGGIKFDDIATGVVKLSYLRIRDAHVALHVEPSIALGDGSDVHHILVDECSANPLGMYTKVLLQDTVIRNILVINSRGNVYYNNIDNPYSLTFEHFWSEGGVGWYGNICARTQILKDSVAFGITNQPSTINHVDKKIYIIDNYLQTYSTIGVYMIYPGAGEKGSIYSNRNISKLGYDLINNSAEVDLKIYSRHNDYLPFGKQLNEALADFQSGAETFTSYSDFIAGRKLGIADNIDLTELTTSNHTPPMYRGLSSARTNAKIIPNKLLECDNVRESDLTGSSIKIKFDCKNSDMGTTVDQDSVSGQKILYVSSTSEFDEEETVEISFGTARQEEGIIDSIQDGISITLKENLTYTHTLVQADSVKKRLRNIGLGFVRYGLSADLDMSTHLPDKTSWGFLYCSFKPDIEEDDGYEWKYTDLEANLVGLKEGTKYYYQVFAYTPLGDLMVGSIEDFTTSIPVDYTDPLEENVREATIYKFAGIDKTGILDLPVEADVRDGVKYDDDTEEGILNLPLESDVRKDIKYDNDTKTGTLEVSGLTAEEIYNYFTDGSRADVFKANIIGLETDITRILGLSQENYRITSTTYTGDLLTASTMKIYPTAADCDADTNAIATYNMTAQFDSNNHCTGYKVTKV